MDAKKEVNFSEILSEKGAEKRAKKTEKGRKIRSHGEGPATAKNVVFPRKKAHISQKRARRDAPKSRRNAKKSER